MTAPVAWRQAPTVPEAARALTAPWRELLVFVVVLGPVARSWSLPGGDEHLKHARPLRWGSREH